MAETQDMIVRIFEDDDILVVDKPSGLVVNKSETTRDATLQDWLQKEYPATFPIQDADAVPASDELDDIAEHDFLSRSGIAHRIDKDTSGILLIAKNVPVFTDLLRQFKSREVEKTYIALVNGEVPEPLIEVDAPIKRHPKVFGKFAVVADGRESKTLIETVKSLDREGNKFTLVNVYPRTGRTHQIRVHLTALNHTIVSDEIYCTRNVLEMNKKYFNRMMLHALSLSFKHPRTNEKVSFVSTLPEEFHL
jgi:23S rRNA pseudouridine1911/1915/1917 synthase